MEIQNLFFIYYIL